MLYDSLPAMVRNNNNMHPSGDQGEGVVRGGSGARARGGAVVTSGDSARTHAHSAHTAHTYTVQCSTVR